MVRGDELLLEWVGHKQGEPSMLARLCVALSIVLSLQQGVSAKTVFVAQSGNNTTGHSWSTAIRSLQDAIYAASEGDTFPRVALSVQLCYDGGITLKCELCLLLIGSFVKGIALIHD